ncbi:uncharacterized protein [Nicotiana tomentosiformis]|uniref:uncharacterized protein n=1 Tax=Nicotiana tomentosiformis TaxID=4098 RepID=UPI00388C8941
MHPTEKEAVDLATFRLRDIAVLWENFSDAFLDQYLPQEIRQARVDHFLALKQGNMSVREYSQRLDSLARYAPSIVATMQERVHKFIAGLALELTEACATATLQDSMDISRIQAFAQNIEKGRHRQHGTERSEQGQHKRMRFARYQEQSQHSYRPQYFGRPPSPPPPQL